MSERDNALIFCLCVISCTILFAAATIIKLLNQKQRVRYNRVGLDTVRDIIASMIKNHHTVGDGSDSNSRSIEVPKRNSPSMEAETDDGTHRSTDTHEAYTYHRYSNGSIDEALDQDDGISVTERSPHGTSIDPPIVSNHSPEPLKRKDSGRGETTPDPKSGRSRTGSVSSSQSHTSKDETTSSKTPPSESSVHMDQTSSKSDKDSSQDVNTSHPSQDETTQRTESGTSRTGSHSPANGNRRNEKLSHKEMFKSITSLPAGFWTHNGPLDQQTLKGGQTERQGPGNGASNENSASGLTGTVKKYIDNISKSTIGYLKDSIFGSKENSKGSPSEDQVTSDPQKPSSDEVD